MSEKGLSIKHFSQIELSQDGSAVLITVEFVDGTTCVFDVPFRNAEWLAKAIFSVGYKAVERQTNSGTIQSSEIADDSLNVNAVRALARPHDQHALIEAMGVWTANGAPGMTSLLVDSAQAMALVEELQEFLKAYPTISRPS